MKLKQIRVDGYKNLINAVLDLGDFNVLVGPNNSGKSNLLEAIQLIGGLCLGSDKLRDMIFHGITPPSRNGTSISHLKKYERQNIRIGISMLIDLNGEIWISNYDTTFKCDADDKGDRGFISEILTAKRPVMTGQATTYIERNEKNLIVKGESGREKSHGISNDNSSISAIRSLYPDYQGLPLELKKSIQGLTAVGTTSIFSISAEDMRQSLRQGKPIEGIHVPSFDLSYVLDKMKEQSIDYNLFEENLCNIMDLEALKIEPIEVPNSSESKKNQPPKKISFLLAKRKGSDFSLIDEYSDGTFAAAALLAILISEGNKRPILCIEELENYLHPMALEKLLRFLQDHADKWPVLITTHSPYLLNGVNPEDVNVAVVDDDGATHFEKVKNSKQLRDYLNKGFMSFGDLLSSNFENVLGRK